VELPCGCSAGGATRVGQLAGCVSTLFSPAPPLKGAGRVLSTEVSHADAERQTHRSVRQKRIQMLDERLALHHRRRHLLLRDLTGHLRAPLPSQIVSFGSLLMGCAPFIESNARLRSRSFCVQHRCMVVVPPRARHEQRQHSR
jgi:hypothetical protein